MSQKSAWRFVEVKLAALTLHTQSLFSSSCQQVSCRWLSMPLEMLWLDFLLSFFFRGESELASHSEGMTILLLPFAWETWRWTSAMIDRSLGYAVPVVKCIWEIFSECWMLDCFVFAISLCDWSRKLVPLYFKFFLAPKDVSLTLIALMIALVLV